MTGNEVDPDAGSPDGYDAVVVGAGFLGMFALYRLRQRGLRVVCLEAGDGVGGTWYWNRYPGARVDIESLQYSYSFDEALQQDWSWSEYFAPQPELEAYANHVADRFGLRDDIRFGTRVVSLEFREADSRWRVTTAAGDELVAKYVIAATGALNEGYRPPIPGADTFAGESYHTSRWPTGVSLASKRVGLIGTGSTGVQAAPVLAEQAGELVVFQRTANFVIPSNNRPLDAAYESEWKADYGARRAVMRTNQFAGYRKPSPVSIFDVSPAEREAVLEEAWNSAAGLSFARAFRDITTDLEANRLVVEFVHRKIREIVRDPATAELLCPKDHPLGSRRLCVGNSYYETYNRPDVRLVDVRSHPIERITPTGVTTSAESFDLDVLVYATGFDAVTGSFLRLEVTGAGGVSLRDKWEKGPTTFLGVAVAGFPNLFLVHGPGSPGVLAQMITSGEWQVDWLVDLVAHAEATGSARVDTDESWEERWAAEVDEAAGHTLHHLASSWYTGANIAGKPQGIMMYLGGFASYVRRCQEQAARGYEGFVLS